MTTTMESAMTDLYTTTTVEDLYTTTIATTRDIKTIPPEVEITTMSSTATSETSTGTPFKVQGDSTNIVLKMQKLDLKKSNIKHIDQMENAKNLTATADIIELSTLETTTNFATTNAVNTREVIENMKETGTKENSTTIASTTESSGISTLANELTTTEVTTTSSPTVSTVTESSMTTENDLTTITDITTAVSTIEFKKNIIKPLSNQIIATTSSPIITTANNLESTNKINELTTSEVTTSSTPTIYTTPTVKHLEHIKNQIDTLDHEEENTSTSSTILTTTVSSFEFSRRKLKATVKPSRSPTTTVSMLESRGRMLTTPEMSTVSTPTIYTDTEPNMLLENDMMTNMADIFGTNMQPNNTGTDVNAIIAIVVSIVGVIALLLLIGFLYLIRRRQKQTKQSQRCHPISSDAYSLDNISVFGSMRRKSITGRASKRTYGNAAFDDPALCHNVLNINELPKFVEHRSQIFAEFRNIPDVTAKITEVPPGCEDKNRFANIVPLPETRVCLQQQFNDEKTEYINANYVRGPNDDPKYYIATQAPLESTIADFWRMIWEQNSRVIIQATDLVENGKDMCYEYLPLSVTLDNSNTFGDFQVILKNREVKSQYAISTLIVKYNEINKSRELTHYWYKWPEFGVPTEEAPIIAMLLEVRASLKSYVSEELNESKMRNEHSAESESSQNGTKRNILAEINFKTQGPLTVHCSPGTGRTGTLIACDMAMRSLEVQNRTVDIPQLVYFIRRGRAGAVKTREQYELIYKVAKVYATKITTIPNDI